MHGTMFHYYYIRSIIIVKVSELVFLCQQKIHLSSLVRCNSTVVGFLGLVTRGEEERERGI